MVIKPLVNILYDYCAGGFPLPGRSFNLDSYRYGHNGQESDAEISGSWGSHYTADYWMYDSRLLRRWETDPITYPWQSPYATFNNNPIFFADPLGLEGGEKVKNPSGGTSTVGEGTQSYNGGQTLSNNGNTLNWSTDCGCYLSPSSGGSGNSHVQLPANKALVAGLATTATGLYKGGNGQNLLDLTESQKQQDFINSAPNTTAILMMEFATGTGEQKRAFNEGHAITNEIKWGLSSRRAIGVLKEKIASGEAVEGQWLNNPIHIQVSPDQDVSWGQSFTYHLEPIFTGQNSAFFRGGMEYNFKIVGKTIHVKVTDAYSIESGLTRDANTNIIRVPGQTTPLGNTQVEFNFKYEFDGIENYK